MQYHRQYLDRTWDAAETMTKSNEAQIEGVEDELDELESDLARVEDSNIAVIALHNSLTATHVSLGE